jgi:hypothetical protein
VAVAWVQYQSGLDTPILEDLHTPLPYFEARWIPSLRSFLAHIDAKLVLDKTYIAPIQREHDEYLMRRIIDTGIFCASDLHIINCCRLYLDVITVSDLLTACGLFMDCQLLLHEPPLSSTSKYHRAVQVKPQKWALWDRAMAICLSDDGALRPPLGPGCTLAIACATGGDPTGMIPKPRFIVKQSKGSLGVNPTLLTDMLLQKCLIGSPTSILFRFIYN